MTNIPYLRLDRIRHNMKVEKLLPPEIARQYHALPISIDGDRITVAISSLSDVTASEVVSSTIGFPVSFVQADLFEIDHRLEEIWQKPPEEKPILLLWSAGSPEDVRLTSYAENLANLLNANLHEASSQQSAAASLAELHRSIEEIQPDLIILNDHLAKCVKNRLAGHKSRKAVQKLASSLIFPFSPRWPLKNLLLILTNSGTGIDPSIEWVSKIAQASQAEVRILVLVPPIPLMYGQTMSYSISGLLRSNDPLGKKVQSVSAHFSDIGIKGKFMLRQGEPECQIWSEISASAPDMIFISEENQSLANKIFSGDAITSLFQLAGCPILYARSC